MNNDHDNDDMGSASRPTKRVKTSKMSADEEDVTTMHDDAARTAGREDDETIREKIGRILQAGFQAGFQAGYDVFQRCTLTVFPRGKSIRAKIRDLLRANRAFLRGSTFTLSETDTSQLQSLREAEPQLVQISADDSDTTHAERGAESDILTRYDITVNVNHFLTLACKPKRFYVREGYKELYEYICEYWKSEDGYRVVLLGNAGTGKSWFQVYALKQLMSCDKDKRDYDFVIRQVASKLYLIDLEEAMVYRWKISTDDLEVLSVALKRTLYFFEPGKKTHESPLDVNLPSLSTLSPYIARIKEYTKDSCKTVYFWPWSSGELWGLIEDSKLQIDQNTFSARYYKFGGVLRHVLEQDQNFENLETQLESRLRGINIDILSTKDLDIDRDQTGNNVSGFLVCHDNRSKEGKDRFAKRNLEYTSAYVEDEVKSRLRTLPMNDIMQIVLQRLSHTKEDISGKNLERTAMELLAQGREFRWQRIEVGSNPIVWENFKVHQRDIIVEFGLDENFRQPDKIIAPKNMIFPGVDFVFSCPINMPPPVPPVVAFQCTWAERHAVKLSALCTLRRKHMKISDNQTLEIYMVCPNQENMYARRTKEQFLVGDLNRDLTVTLETQTTVNATELGTMWANTKIFVIRPKSSWQEKITDYLSKH